MKAMTLAFSDPHFKIESRLRKTFFKEQMCARDTSPGGKKDWEFHSIKGSRLHSCFGGLERWLCKHKELSSDPLHLRKD